MTREDIARHWFSIIFAVFVPFGLFLPLWAAISIIGIALAAWVLVTEIVEHE